ncbi:hypothetical protein HK096_008117 [Nowakowskiella sp. JEL0078]|nr:hypothetical protein HK096_008117 [Nowakowskiella sp. JEL0078]
MRSIFVCFLAIVSFVAALPENYLAKYQQLINGNITLPSELLTVLSQADSTQLHYLTLYATGTQNYKCVAGANGTFAWQLQEPVANLYLPHFSNEKPSLNRVGIHGFNSSFAGPAFWRIFALGASSVVYTKKLVAVASSTPASNIPWLGTQTITSQIDGKINPLNQFILNLFKSTKYVFRVATQGGVNPKGSVCSNTDLTANTVIKSAYTAQYWFYVNAKDFTLLDISKTVKDLF